MSSDKLKLNIDKNQLIIISTRQQLAKNNGVTITLSHMDGEGKSITPASNSRIFSLIISDNLTWSAHLERGMDAILKKCRQKLGALKFDASIYSFNKNKRLVDAVIMSCLTYGIQI